MTNRFTIAMTGQVLRAPTQAWRIVSAAILALLLSAGAQAQTTVEYIHTDALGSPVAVTDAFGNVIEHEVYEPYGSPITRPPSDQPGFTGHVADSLTGLTYMQQRYYDPQVGRFLSVDPVTAHSNPVGAFNRYWYANNNPYRFTDPDGREIEDEVKSPTPPVQDMERVTITATRPQGTQAASVVTLGTVFVERIAPGTVSWISPTLGAAVAAPFLLFATPDPCGGIRCGELPFILNEAQPDERDLVIVPEREGNRIAQDHGFIDAHDAKDGRGGGGVDIYKDKKNGDYWLWNGAKGGEKDAL